MEVAALIHILNYELDIIKLEEAITTADSTASFLEDFDMNLIVNAKIRLGQLQRQSERERIDREVAKSILDDNEKEANEAKKAIEARDEAERMTVLTKGMRPLKDVQEQLTLSRERKLEQQMRTHAGDAAVKRQTLKHVIQPIVIGSPPKYIDETADLESLNIERARRAKAAEDRARLSTGGKFRETKLRRKTRMRTTKRKKYHKHRSHKKRKVKRFSQYTKSLRSRSTKI